MSNFCFKAKQTQNQVTFTEGEADCIKQIKQVCLHVSELKYILYINLAKIPTKLLSFIHISVSVVRWQNESEMIHEDHMSTGESLFQHFRALL